MCALRRCASEPLSDEFMILSRMVPLSTGQPYIRRSNPKTCFHVPPTHARLLASTSRAPFFFYLEDLTRRRHND